MKIFNLPDLGEGLPDAEIVSWHVKEGDSVSQDQLLVSMETAKAVVDVPSPYSGKVTKLHGNQGDIIETGKPLVSFEAENSAKVDSGTVVGKVEVGSEVVQEKAFSISRSSNVKVLPAIRALAKKLNVDLTTITPSGPQGTITKEDVEQAHERDLKAGPLELLRGVRRSMAITMQQSHSEVVPVTIFEDADITDWKNKDFTVRLLKAIAYACLKEPALNAWYDGQAIGRRLLNHCHIGLAMDTQEGLFVPVLENVQDKNISELRAEIETLKEEVLNRSIKTEKLRGHTITLSNFGNFAGRYASPIVVPPTVAIIGVGKVREEVKPINGDIACRVTLPISLTFDHRAVTGGEATRFLAAMLETLRKPEPE